MRITGAQPCQRVLSSYVGNSHYRHCRVINCFGFPKIYEIKHEKHFMILIKTSALMIGSTQYPLNNSGDAQLKCHLRTGPAAEPCADIFRASTFWFISTIIFGDIFAANTAYYFLVATSNVMHQYENNYDGIYISFAYLSLRNMAGISISFQAHFIFKKANQLF